MRKSFDLKGEDFESIYQLAEEKLGLIGDNMKRLQEFYFSIGDKHNLLQGAKM